MTRQHVRSQKKAVRASGRPDASNADHALARECALSLLARSIQFGHGRLAVVRLAMAANSGAQIPAEHWEYCARVAQASGDARLHDLYLEAAATGLPTPGPGRRDALHEDRDCATEADLHIS